MLFNIPPSTTSLAEGVERFRQEPRRAERLEALGYGGPAPPIGRHHFFQALRPDGNSPREDADKS